MKYLFIIIPLFFLVSCGSGEKKKINKAKETRLTQEESLEYIKKGNYIVKGSTRVLGTHIKEEISSGGILSAVEYCRLVANPLVDSLSKEFGVKIARLSHKARNPKNNASADELLILEEFQEIAEGGMHSPPIVTQYKNQTRFYSPIHTKLLCLNCHGGVKSNIGEDKYNAIKKLYPNDQAIDFAEGDLRGMWVIDFDDKKSK